MTTRTKSQHSAVTSLGAVALVYAPYLYALSLHLSGRELSLAELILYPLALGGGTVALTFALMWYLFGERPSDLSTGKGRWPTDILAGVLICALSFVVTMGASSLLSPALSEGGGPPPRAIAALLESLAAEPLLLALWLGPVVWIGVALFEELARVFLLHRLWTLWPGAGHRWGTILVSAALFGLVHLYQGAPGAVAIGLLSFLLAVYYMRFRRLWPLVIGHALFDSIQIMSAVSSVHEA